VRHETYSTFVESMRGTSGQQVNLNKPKVFISNNISHAAKEDLANFFRSRSYFGHANISGPTLFGKEKHEDHIGLHQRYNLEEDTFLKV